MVKIFQKSAPILRGVAKPVKISEVKSAKIKKVLADMRKALNAEEDGVAIAAPQIGVPLSIFIVSHRVFDIMDDVEGTTSDKKIKRNDLVFINPEIVRLSREKEWVDEGCLSVRWLYGKVQRSKKAKVRAYNELGNQFEMGASGLLAQVFQHETDHLKGVLFIDKADRLEEIPPEKIRTV